MGKIKVSREVTADDVHCLENLVVAYNTVFLMSSIFIVVIASTTRELFSDFNRILSPSLLLVTVGCFIVFIATLGYVGIVKKSSSIMSLYAMILIFIFIMEVSAGFAILSFRKDIKATIYSRMERAIDAYPTDPMVANLVDYVQLELKCCGADSYMDWEDVLEPTVQTSCKISYLNLPPSCCTRAYNSSLPAVNTRGCLSAANLMLHRSCLSLATATLAICTIQILGAYFSYSLATSLSKYKIQRANSEIPPPQYDVRAPTNYNEKSGYF